MMTKGEFLNRFHRQPDGAWCCTKPIKVDGPSGPFTIRQGVIFNPGALLLGLDLFPGTTLKAFPIVRRCPSATSTTVALRLTLRPIFPSAIGTPAIFISPLWHSVSPKRKGPGKGRN